MAAYPSVPSALKNTYFLARLANGPLAAATGKQAGDFALFPNPGGGQQPVWVQGLAAGQQVVVRDALGRLLSQGRVPAGSAPFALPRPANGLAPGLYLVQAGAVVRRLVIE